ncbi:MAG TPA: STAS domain-containing protein [Nevskiaceae bacterium]|nr:STAS domain-containing protein [Nevskiaceae bacterium]
MALPLDGALDFAGVGRWLARADELVAAGGLDLSAVSRVDSAGIALLLELRRRAERSGQRLPLSGVPEQARSLMRFLEVDTLLLDGAAPSA